MVISYIARLPEQYNVVVQEYLSIKTHTLSQKGREKEFYFLTLICFFFFFLYKGPIPIYHGIHLLNMVGG